jgi:hypothetical protein
VRATPKDFTPLEDRVHQRSSLAVAKNLRCVNENCEGYGQCNRPFPGDPEECPRCGNPQVPASDPWTALGEVTYVAPGLVDESIAHLQRRQRRLPHDVAALKKSVAEKEAQQTDLVADIAATRLRVEARLVNAATLEARIKRLAALRQGIAESRDDLAALEALVDVIPRQIGDIVEAKRTAMQAEAVATARRFSEKAAPLLKQLQQLVEQAGADGDRYEQLFADGFQVSGAPRIGRAFGGAASAIGVLKYFGARSTTGQFFNDASQFPRQAERLK